MHILEQAQQVSPALAEYIEHVAERDFAFQGNKPHIHSGYNHVHLWMLEKLADEHEMITVAFRCKTVAYIFERWKVRLKNFWPYLRSGYRVYLLEAIAPTVSVVAETPIGCPYSGSAIFVETIEAVLQPYSGHSWRSLFSGEKAPDPQAILRLVEQAHGSIGKPVAQQMGMQVAELRKLIENVGLAPDVNRIRKRYKRSPARFDVLETRSFPYRVFEWRLPPRYD